MLLGVALAPLAAPVSMWAALSVTRQLFGRDGAFDAGRLATDVLAVAPIVLVVAYAATSFIGVSLTAWLVSRSRGTLLCVTASGAFLAGVGPAGFFVFASFELAVVLWVFVAASCGAAVACLFWVTAGPAFRHGDSSDGS